MLNRSATLFLVLAATLALAACGGESEGSTTSTDQPLADANPDTTVDTQAETTADEGAGDTAGGGDGCDQVLTPDEIESVFGTPVEIKGSSQFCTIIFASDAVGNLSAFSGSEADEAISTLLAQFLADETDGVLLEQDRGFVDQNSAIVRGDSGRVFRFDAPDSIDVPDSQAAMQDIAELLLTRW